MVDMPEHATVLVVGAGPVGLTMANLLGVAGVDVLLIERDAGLAQISRAVALDDEGMRAIQAAELVEQIAPMMLMGYDHHMFGRNAQLLFKVDPVGQEYGFPKRNRFHQPELEQVLLDGLDRFPNVRVRFGARLIDLSVDETGSSATVEIEGGQSRIRARRVVACDGGGSSVRRLLGIEMQGESHPAPWIVIDTENNPDDARYSRAIGDPRRPTVNVPGVSGRRRYEFMLLPGEKAEEMTNDRSVAQLLAPWCDLDQVRVTRAAVYTFHSLIAERFEQGRRAFLAGDAAHMMPPFQGQGMNSGMRDAFNLAWKLAAVERGQLGDSLLDSYEQERQPHAREMIDISRKVGSLLMTRSGVAAWCRDTAFATLARFGASRRYLGQMRFKPPPRAQAGFFVSPGRGWSGRMFIQPDVIDGTGRRVPLDAVLGDGFALMQIAADDRTPFAEFDHPVWTRLNVKRICVLPGGLDRIVEGADALCADIGATIARAAGPAPVTLLLRPDRFVAAVISPGDATRVAEQLDAIAGLPSQRMAAPGACRDNKSA